MSEEKRDGKSRLNRRDVVTASAAGAAAVVAAGTVAAQTFQVQKGATMGRHLGGTKLNAGAKAILPDGSLADRGEILTKLGLNPNTPPDAWLAIIGCGSNASALTTQQLDSIRPQLQQKGIIIQGGKTQ